MYKIDKPKKHYAKWKKPDIEDYILDDFIYKKNSEEANAQRQKMVVCGLGTMIANGTGKLVVVEIF